MIGCLTETTTCVVAKPLVWFDRSKSLFRKCNITTEIMSNRLILYFAKKLYLDLENFVCIDSRSEV